jgi:putative spermidine/putrescine transport system permease protein
MEQIKTAKTVNPVRTIIYLGIALGVVIPMLPQLVWAFSHRWLFPSILPSELSMRAWDYIANPNTKVLSSTLNSLIIALSVTVISILVGVPAGKALGMYKFRGKNIIELIILSPTIIPGLAVTMGMQVIFIRLGLTDTMLGVIIVHLIPTIPYMTISMSGIFANYDPAFEEQARSLGAGSVQTFFLITLPTVFPGIITGAMFAFLISWGQYILTIIIGGGRVITLPLLLFSFAGSGDFALTSALSIIFLLPSIIILFMTSKYLSGKSSAMGGFGNL